MQDLAENVVADDDLLDEGEAAKIVRQQKRTLTVWRCTGRGPRFMKLGRRVFYRRQWLADYMASCEIDPGAR